MFQWPGAPWAPGRCVWELGKRHDIEREVRRLGADRLDDVVRVLAEAFGEYPVMRFVTGGEDQERLRSLVRLFVGARVLREEPLLGVHHGTELVAVATASFPEGPPTPPAFEALRTEAWSLLGGPARARYDAFSAATQSFRYQDPHVHLNMVGVRRAFRGRGLGRRLIDEVQEISRGRAGSRGVSLTTEDPANVVYYESLLGFQCVGHAKVAPALETWGFFRANE